MKFKPLLTAVFLILLLSTCALTQSLNDSVLKRIMDQDGQSRDAGGSLTLLPAQEHLSRADIYQTNRHFPEAREHWMKYLANYKDDPAGIAKALFGIGRGYMWEREYQKAIDWFEKLKPDYLTTKEGREGIYFLASCHNRLNRNLEAAKGFELYVAMFPNGERIDGAHLNIIDNYREAGRFREANDWFAKTRTKFAATPTEVNAVQAKLRMEIGRKNWREAVAAADALLALRNFKGSMVTQDEVQYLKAFALEKEGRKTDAASAYSAVKTAINSYWGGLASDGLKRLDSPLIKTTGDQTSNAYAEYPLMFTEDVLREARARKIDPRFVLAIMKQESSFNPRAKSPAAARGLLQLVYDTAVKYNVAAGRPNVVADDLYDPSTNISIGLVYIAALHKEFNGMYEAIASSYNAGEDNTARWLARTNPKDPGVFTAEVGFAETKNYVYKVMGNYRAYVALYDENLGRR